MIYLDFVVFCKMSLEPDSAIQPGQAYKPICLGVLGKREDISREEFYDKIIHPMMSLLGKLPDKVLVASEGTTSAITKIWAERCAIKSESIVADWHRFGRRACVLRDARILKEATHLLLFEQPRSEAILRIGVRELKKGKSIFSVTAGKEWEFQEWEAETQCAIK